MLTILKQFEHPDEVPEFEKGRFEVVQLADMTIGRATYEPGWKWSVHVAPTAGTALCEVEHFGMVLTGCAAVSYEDGTVEHLEAGTLFYIPAVPHDSWVVGQEPYVSIHLGGTHVYAK